MINIGRNLINTPRKVAPVSTLFGNASIIELVKTAIVYKASQNDFVLSKGDSMTKYSYKMFGKELTNAVIENTGGLIFTAGPTIKTLINDVDKLYTDKGIWSAGNYVLEGIERDCPDTFDDARDYLVETMDRCTGDRPYCSLAIKLTGLGHMEMFRIYHRAQHLLLREMFRNHSVSHLDGRMVLTRDGIKEFLNSKNIEFTSTEIDEFFGIAKFDDSKYGSDEIGEIEFYENVHAHYVNSDNHNSAIIKRICASVGLKKNTRLAIERFQKRALDIVETAAKYDTKLLIDAEQTYIQKALDSFTRQLQTMYHRDRPAFILNGYQSYLKSSPFHIAREIERCKTIGIGAGVKLIRGAYMEEERQIARENHYPSPVWDTIEETHISYDKNVARLLKNLDPEKGKPPP